MVEDIRSIIQKEATNSILKNRFIGLLLISPRVGKTKIVIDALNTVEKELRILVLAPKKPIFKSWKLEIKKWKLKQTNITFLWSNSINKTEGFYDLIICDEIHEYNNKVINTLKRLQKKGSRLLSLTGTLDPIKEELLLKQLNINCIYRYTIAQAIKDGIIADYEIICKAVQLDNTDKYIIAGSKDKPFKQTEQEAYNYWNRRYNLALINQDFKYLDFLMSQRIKIIYNSISKLKATQELLAKQTRAIVFTGRQEIADQICNSYHSKSENNNLELFSNEEINHLSVVSLVSMGLTFTNLKVAIFNQLKSNENLALQQAMRTMNMDDGRKATIYIIYLEDTRDEEWLKNALRGFDSNKITFI